MNITMHALRCIDKAGGFDEYVLTTPDHKLDNDQVREWRSIIGAVYANLYNVQVSTLTVKPGCEGQVPRHLQARLKGVRLEDLEPPKL
jgi:large subunit ribosomal protein L28